MTEPGSMARDWRTLGLDASVAQHRRTLIEASAGTGKTWTISVLYLRLLLESGRRAREIVVTTFTDAASQELRERIRSRLTWALHEAASARDALVEDSEMTVRQWLHERWQTLPVQRDVVSLKLALSELDLAPIGTMHALCLKILGDAPFAAGTGFRVGEMTSTDALSEELGADVIRTLAHQSDDDEEQRAAVAALLRISPKDRANLLRALLTDGVTLRAATTTSNDLLDDAAHWSERLHQLVARDLYKRNGSKIANQLQNLAGFLDAGDALGDYKSNGALDDPADLEELVRPDRVTLMRDDPIYRHAVELNARLNNRKRAAQSRVLLALATRVRNWRDARLNERQQLSFDGLIGAVHDAMTRPRTGGVVLADRLYATWPVALIDEFQDTDSRQYAIFDQIYRDAEGDARGQLILIGDPKQAIYRFRGGDIHAYLRAASASTQCMRLGVNYRSATPLVEAVNDFYDACGDGFAAAHERIRYSLMSAAGHADQERLRLDGARVDRPLIVHDLAAFDEAAALDACANLIARYLQPGYAALGDTPLRPGDIAVLLPANHQIAATRRLLAARRVPCVGAGRASVFESEAATQLRVVLYAIANHRDAHAVRAALASPYFGLNFDALRALEDDAHLWHDYAEQFMQLSLRWDRAGVLGVVDALLAQAAAQLLNQSEGERMLTDLRHLGEILQRESTRMHGRDELLAWLARQCEGATGNDESAAKERLLRIESDQARVQLLTLHAAKGLEFPIVMLPLMWAHRGRDEDFPITTGIDGTRVLDLGSEQVTDAQQIAAGEARQERMRVLYVALTRAEQACHLFLGPPPKHAGAIHNAGLDVLREHWQWPLLQASAHIEIVADAPTGFVQLKPASADPTPRLVRAPRRGHRLLVSHSFSTLTHGFKQLVLPDAVDDASTIPEIESTDDVAAPHPALTALADFRGAAFGTALHGILEHRDPTTPLATQRGLIREQLASSGVLVPVDQRELLIDALVQRLDACLHADIAPGLRLIDLTPTQSRAEMDFQFLLDQADVGALRNLCAQHGEDGLIPAHLGWHELSGFMTGKIDLVFTHGGQVHVADYKSNDLGDRLDGYQGEALDAAMSRDHYPFQAFIYTLAVDRYLQGRIADYRRERDLGSCFYLYLRALGLDADSGVWRHRFAPEFIAHSQALFAGVRPEVRR